MIEKIAAALQKQTVLSSWAISERQLRSTQLYEVFGKRESIRAVDATTYDVDLHVPISTDGTDRMGSIRIEIAPGETGIDTRIRRAIESASVHGNRPFMLTEAGMVYPDFQSADPDIVTNPWQVIDDIHESLREEAAKAPDIRISSTEVFVKYLRQRLVNSRGLDVSQDYTDCLWEIVLFHGRKPEESEFWAIFSRPQWRQLNIGEKFGVFAQHARNALIAKTPRSGNCPVVLTGDALEVLYQYLIHHASASARFTGSSLFEPGRPVLPDEPQGDRFTMYSNSIISGGSYSRRFDPDGLPGTRVRIIHDGVLERFWATQQYAQYLGIEPTGAFANIELPPGTRSWEELLQSDDRVILVEQFSTFDPQPVAGNYLGEIRVGYEYRADGSVVPLRGGSVTGNVVSGLTNARFCREMEIFQGYYGPRGVRFEEAQVAGL